MGKGPYSTGPLDSAMFKSSGAVYGERDVFMWGAPGGYRGYWPAQTVNAVPFDPPNSWGFSMVKIHPQSKAGTVLLRSNDPRDVPDINFRFFEGPGDQENDLQAFAEAVEFGRNVLDSVAPPSGPFTENFPCEGDSECDVKEMVKTQTWSHHATSSSAIGADVGQWPFWTPNSVSEAQRD